MTLCTRHFVIAIAINGSLALKIGSYLQVPKNGNSMIAAIRAFLDIKCEEFPEDSFFPNRYMKRWLCSLVIKHKRVIMDRYKLHFREMYGSQRKDVPVGPFTFKGYCEALLEREIFGDEPLLFALARETKLKIMIVLHPSLVLYHIDRPVNLKTADIVLVFNGEHQFTPAGNDHFFHLYPHFRIVSNKLRFGTRVGSFVQILDRTAHMWIVFNSTIQVTVKINRQPPTLCLDTHVAR